jgi:hypothetical protein
VGESETAEGLFLGGGWDKAGGDVMPWHAFWAGFFLFCERERGWILRYLKFGYFLLAARVSIWSLDVLSPRVVERGQFHVILWIT